MMSTDINVNAIINQLQELVVKLKDDKPFTSVHSMASNVRKQVRDRDESSQLIKMDREKQLVNQDSGELRRLNANNQLHEYSEENRKLRKLYEDSMNAIEIVMDRHRNLVMNSIRNRKEAVPPSIAMPDYDTINKRKNEKTAEVIMAVDLILKAEKERFSKNCKEAIRLEAENKIIRNLLELEAQSSSNVDELNNTIINTAERTTKSSTNKIKDQDSSS